MRPLCAMRLNDRPSSSHVLRIRGREGMPERIHRPFACFVCLYMRHLPHAIAMIYVPLGNRIPMIAIAGVLYLSGDPSGG